MQQIKNDIQIIISKFRMGNKQKESNQSNTQEFNYERFKQYHPDSIIEQEEEPQDTDNILQLDSFKCVDIKSLGVRNQRDFQMQINDSQIVISKSFQTCADLEAYVSNLIKLSKILDIVLYDQIKIQNNQSFSTEISLQVKNGRQIDSCFAKNSTLNQKIDLLNYIAIFLGNFKNLYICPQFLIQSSTNGFYLINFVCQQTFTSVQIFLGFLRWLFSDNLNFYECLISQHMPGNMPIYFQDIYNSLLINGSATVKQIQGQLKKIKDKMFFLMNRADSFYACKYFNKTVKYIVKSDWIFLKSKHQIFFYHIKDHHSFTGKLYRKKKKKDIDQCHITFDHEDLQILYVPENSKFMVRAAQFEFESNSSISDIEVKHKLPVKFKNCLINRARNGCIYLLQQYLYRYVAESNKLIQESKRIPDYIFLTTTKDSVAFIIKTSIDIFRNGIRVFYKNQDIVLAHTGEQKMLQQISSIRVDIRHVIFCIEVYKGVFLMMASNNLWVLDLNFQCYFSFATPTQIKKLTTFKKQKNTIEGKQNDLLFEVIGQPFKVDFNIQNDGNHVSIKDNYLHILGLIQQQPYYLRYSFMHRIGAIKLEGYHPLFVGTPYTKVRIIDENIQVQKYKFNFHEQNSHLYKYRKWIYKGDLMVKVYNFTIKFDKSTYQVHLQIQKIDETLKQHIQKLQKYNKKLSQIQMTALLYRIYLIYEYLFTNSITHSNISINHICFTNKKQLKIHGWSEPPRNWHVSDFKDYLLVCFNIITYNCYQKISEKIISKHSQQLSQFGILSQKISTCFRQAKTIQKRTQIQKSLLVIKSFLQKQLADMLQTQTSSKYILSFEYKTPRMNIINTQTMKMKKIIVIPDQTIAQEFTFNQTDKYIWVQDKSMLYIFTTSFQFYELKVNLDNQVQDKVCLEDYQYLPYCISLCTFVAVHGDVYCFGGIKKEQDGRSTYNKKIYKFSWKALTWQAISQMPQPRISPHAVVSNCKRYIYLIGGIKQLQLKYLKLIKYDLQTMSSQILIDESSDNIISLQNYQSPMKFFHLSDKLNIFLQWTISEGDYIIRYISYSSIGFSIQMRVKNYSSQNNLTQQSVSLDGNVIHILRPYGRYAKITMNRLESISLKNQTIYAI